MCDDDDYDAVDAIYDGSINDLRRLIERDPKMVTLCDAGSPPLLHFAAEYSASPDIIMLLAEHGADVNFAWSGRTALHVAAKCSLRSDTVRSLLQLGADPNLVTRGGDYTPLLLAAFWHPDGGIPDVLIEYGARVDFHSAVLLHGYGVVRPDSVHQMLKDNPNAIREAPRSHEISFESSPRLGSAPYSRRSRNDATSIGRVLKISSTRDRQEPPSLGFAPNSKRSWSSSVFPKHKGRSRIALHS